MNKRKTSAGWNLRAVMALLILAAFLTSACGQKGQTEQVQETETGEAAEEAAEGEVTAPEEGDTSAKETTEQELLSGELPPWVLYESEKWTVTLNDALDPDDLNARLLLTVDNRCDYNLNVEITEIVINETYRSDEYEYCSSDPHDTNTDDLYGTNRWLSQFSEEIGDLKTISLHLVIEKNIEEDLLRIAEKEGVELSDICYGSWCVSDETDTVKLRDRYIVSFTRLVNDIFDDSEYVNCAVLLRYWDVKEAKHIIRDIVSKHFKTGQLRFLVDQDTSHRGNLLQRFKAEKAMWCLFNDYVDSSQ